MFGEMMIEFFLRHSYGFGSSKRKLDAYFHKAIRVRKDTQVRLQLADSIAQCESCCREKPNSNKTASHTLTLSKFALIVS